jgi:hypothetical protein
MTFDGLLRRLSKIETSTGLQCGDNVERDTVCQFYRHYVQVKRELHADFEESYEKPPPTSRSAVFSTSKLC